MVMYVAYATRSGLQKKSGAAATDFIGRAQPDSTVFGGIWKGSVESPAPTVAQARKTHVRISMMVQRSCTGKTGSFPCAHCGMCYRKAAVKLWLKNLCRVHGDICGVASGNPQPGGFVETPALKGSRLSYLRSKNRLCPRNTMLDFSLLSLER
jgi:hypothetical protein